MQEIFNTFNRQNNTEKSVIEFQSEPQIIFGASVKKEFRILYFESEQPENFYIDFIPHQGNANTVYIVPSGHLLYLPYSSIEIHCISIPISCIDDAVLSWLYSYRYEKQKFVSVSTQVMNLLYQEKLFHFLELMKAVFNISAISQLYKVKELCSILDNTICTHTFTVKELAGKLCLTQPTLWRICNAFFCVSPQTITKYHLALKSIYCLLYNKHYTINQVADHLGFNDVTTFSRFVKAEFLLSPATIRRQYVHLSI